MPKQNLSRKTQRSHLLSLARAIVDLGQRFEAAIKAEQDAPSDADPWVPHHEWPMPRRTALDLARSGAIKARKMGRSWLARQSEIDRYVMEHGRTVDQMYDDRAIDTDDIEIAARAAAGGRR